MLRCDTGGGGTMSHIQMVTDVLIVSWYTGLALHTAQTVGQRWTVTLMTDFYFAIGPNPKDVFVVVGEKWILYKHCETEDLAKAIVEGQNKSREGKDD